MTFFGWLLVAMLTALFAVGLQARGREDLDLPDGFDRVLFIIGCVIVGILTIGTGSLVQW